MATVTSLTYSGLNTPAGAGNGIINAQKARNDDGNYCELDTVTIGLIEFSKRSILIIPSRHIALEIPKS